MIPCGLKVKYIWHLSSVNKLLHNQTFLMSSLLYRTFEMKAQSCILLSNSFKAFNKINRFHVAKLLCQFSNRSQMTSKQVNVRTKKGGVHKAIAKCVTDVPDATGNKKDTNVSLTSLQTLIEEKRLPQKLKEHMKLK